MYLKCTYPYVERPSLWSRLFKKKKSFEIPPSLEGRYNDLIGVLIAWMKERQFIQSRDKNDEFGIKYIPTPGNLSTPSYLGIATFNLRRLILDETDEKGRTPLESYLHLISDHANGIYYPLSDFISLIDSLVAFYPEELLDCIVNKVYRSVATFSNKDEWNDWVLLHQYHPYLWITFYIQFLLYRYSDPRLMVRPQ